MKTGRRRKKAPAGETPEPAPSEAAASPAPSSKPTLSAPRVVRPVAQRIKQSKLSPGLIILPIFVAIIVLILAIVLCSTCLGPREQPASYLPATVSGSWATTVEVLVPQTTVQDRFRSDCEADPNCAVIPGTCQMREREDAFSERVVDEYDDFAYSIYYEETEGKLYEASGTDFVVTRLNEDEDYWEEERHYIKEEWLDRETCQYTSFTVWITDPEDEQYEAEVVLSECEVWDHVVVKEKVYEPEAYCQTENAGTMVVQETLTQQGTGARVEWAAAIAPAGGELERAFQGDVVFSADGVTHARKVDDADQYVRYLTVPYYIGVNAEGDFLRLTDRPE